METEYFFQCPYCTAEISMLLDLSISNQSYIEDCEICCKPIEINYEVQQNTIISFKAEIVE